VEQVTGLPSGEEKRRAVREMFDRIAPRYDRLNRILSLRLDQRWRRAALRALDLGPSDALLDLACGTGDFLVLARPTGARLVGADFSREMLRCARRRGITAPLIETDAARLPLASGAVTALTCGFALRNFVRLDEVIAEAARVLAPGGRMALLEVDAPASALLRAGHAFYFQRVVPWLGAWLSDRAAYRYLPRSVEYLPPEPDLLALITRAGFTRVLKHRLSGGIVQLLTAEREGRP
jgi:demethylmenaquinone methyltransferase/2-methoxy-6-polyprenyl-1,4-benzoquinol methylase